MKRFVFIMAGLLIVMGPAMAYVGEPFSGFLAVLAGLLTIYAWRKGVI
jgi:hypothetical protein